MRKIKFTFVAIGLAIALAIFPYASYAANGDTYAEGYADGKMEAQTLHSSTGWAIGGAASGFLLGIIGGIGAVGLSAVSGGEPSGEQLARIQGKAAEYRLGYIEGYKSVAKKKNLTSATGGAAAGVLLWLLVLSAASSSSSY